MRKIVHAILFLSFLFGWGQFVLAQDQDSNVSSQYQKALAVFYEARHYQSNGDFFKALQRYEEAFRLFQKLSGFETPFGAKAKRKIGQIERDVKRIERAHQ